MNDAIDIRNLVVKFITPRGVVTALDGIDLTVKESTVYGFLGPNGAGKTTTMHVLLGFVEPTSGEARMFGQDVRKSIARKRIGYLSEHPQTYPYLTSEELLTMAGRIFGLRGQMLKERIRSLLEQVNLTDAAKRKIGTYSRGMMQRIGLAQALINDPDLVILDEPMNGLDPVGRKEVRSIITDLRERGKTVFFSSHELSEVSMVCNEIAILDSGKVVAQGASKELVPDNQTLEQYFLELVH